MDDEELIEYVREQRVLYDFSDPFYSDNNKKFKTWQEIGFILKQDPNKCKTRWESLRSQFRKHIRSKKTITGQSTGSPLKWKYHDNLLFLIPHLKDKTRYSSIATENEDHKFTLDADEPDVVNEVDESQNSEAVNPSFTLNRLSKDGTRSKRKSLKPTKSTSGVLMKHNWEEEKKLKESEEKDEIDLFFDTMKATVKKFSEANKILAKQRVFNIITELEGINLSQKDLDKVNQSFPSNLQTYHHLANNTTSIISPSTSQCTSSYLNKLFSRDN